MKIAFLSLGCKVNAYETEKMKQKFMEADYEIVDFNEKADAYVVNTCTVTNIADRKSRKMLHRAKKTNNDALVIACGCYVDSKDDLTLEDEGIICIDNSKKYDVFNIVHQKLLERKTDNKGENCINKHYDTHDIKSHTRAYIKIQDGCNQYCSYCIIPYVRGRLQSRDEDDVVKEVESLVAEGYMEIVITGIHVSSYGADRLFEGEKINSDTFVKMDGKPLLSLLLRLNSVKELKRIRLSSLEPRIITENFIKELSKMEKVCPHFHLSLQSGSDKTLKNMNRHYTSSDYLKSVEIIRKYYKDPAITTDIIVGFPRESDEDFLECMNFAKKVRFQDIHVFKYSIRQGTVAARMDNQIPERTKADRSKELILLALKLKEEYCRRYIGKDISVLIEKCVEIDGKKFYSGHTENYIKVYICDDSSALKDGDDLVNKLVVVKGKRYENEILFAS